MTTFDESQVRRVQHGVSTGGQFATQPKAESGVELAAVPQPLAEGTQAAIRNPWDSNGSWLHGQVTYDVPGFPDKIGIRLPAADTVYVTDPADILADVDPWEYDGDDVDTLAQAFSWSAKDWESYHDSREAREQEQAFEAGKSEATELEHPAGAGTVQTWVGDDGVPVFQIDSNATGRIRVNLNDAPVWDGDPETDESASAKLEKIEELLAGYEPFTSSADRLSVFDDDDAHRAHLETAAAKLDALVKAMRS
ncbi:hypothetical protein [Pseudactinotalea terrae]|uniref:hypothetical protein n=1 Tax=Pseudactinotalea terrae TaxID=1743262 RepID=UPI0012E149F7|nr:hypothetical protein [Pseudactinotalea terrae]